MTRLDAHRQVERVVGRMARALSRHGIVAGDLEAELSAACRRAVLCDIGEWLVKLGRRFAACLTTLFERAAREIYEWHDSCSNRPKS